MKWIKFIFPVLILLAAIGISFLIMQSSEKPAQGKRKIQPTAVEVIPLKKQDFQVVLQTQGTVKPRTESSLIPEVSGKIIYTSDHFQEGAFFEKGDELLRIDASNYDIAVTVTKSQLAEAQLALAEEQALAKQALRNWQRLGKTTQPTALVLHKPQLARAKAKVASAKALLKQAQLDLQRTRIKAPYAGRVMEKMADVGQYVSPGTELAKIFAVDIAEIRLPLSNQQLGFIDLPESYRGKKQPHTGLPEVILSSNFGNRQYQWPGRIVRTEGTFDTKSRRLFVVAQVDNPYGLKETNKPPLKIGQYVEAKIKGKILENVFIIPRAAVRENSQILLVDKNNQLLPRQIKPVWQDNQVIIIADGAEEGDLLCITPVASAAKGMPVSAIIKNHQHLPSNPEQH